MNQVKEILIPIYEYLKTYLFFKTINLNINKETKNIYMFLLPDYGNLGDVAILKAQEEFIKNNYPNYNIVGISVANTYNAIRTVKKNMKEDDIITIIGGGNLGNLYSRADYGRLFIIKTFKNNKIISFPQSYGFSNTKYAQRRLKANKKVINQHANITLFAREKVSFDLMKKNFSEATIKLCPDIVLYLDKNVNLERKTITFALRGDEEKKINLKSQQNLIDTISKKYNDVIFQDTTIPNEEFKEENKYDYLGHIFKVFQQSKLIITDRLHGMIFSYITSTPCIVLPNNNHKISSTYQTWLKDCNFIKFIEEEGMEKIDEMVEKLIDLKEIEKNDLKAEFKELKEIFK